MNTDQDNQEILNTEKHYNILICKKFDKYITYFENRTNNNIQISPSNIKKDLNKLKTLYKEYSINRGVNTIWITK